MTPVVPHPEVESEIDEAIAYYERKKTGLGLEFHATINEAFERIAAHPNWFPQFADTGFRKCFVRRFPYTVYFREEGDYNWVVAVSHQKRRPGYWLGRSTTD